MSDNLHIYDVELTVLKYYDIQSVYLTLHDGGEEQEKKRKKKTKNVTYTLIHILNKIREK